MGTLIKRLRRKRQLTQQELADLCGLSVETIKHVENSYDLDIKLSTLIKIATGLNVKVIDLIPVDNRNIFK